MKHIIYFLLVTCILSGCELIPDLERDNPNDEKSENYKGNNEDDDDDNKTYELEFDRYEYYFYWNKPEPGQFVTLRLFVKNSGTGTLKNIIGNISSTSQYISQLTVDDIFFSPDGYIEEVQPNTVVQGYLGKSSSIDRSTEFQISSLTPVGTVLNFKLELKDNENRHWTENFTINVQ